MQAPRTLRALFSLPGFVASARLKGVFGDRFARVVVLRRRKNGAVLVLRSSVPWPLRPAHGPRPRPRGRRLAALPRVRALACVVPAVPQRVRRAARLAGRESALYAGFALHVWDKGVLTSHTCVAPAFPSAVQYEYAFLKT